MKGMLLREVTTFPLINCIKFRTDKIWIFHIDGWILRPNITYFVVLLNLSSVIHVTYLVKICQFLRFIIIGASKYFFSSVCLLGLLVNKGTPSYVDNGQHRHWLKPTIKYKFFYVNKTCYKCYLNIITTSIIII